MPPFQRGRGNATKHTARGGTSHFAPPANDDRKPAIVTARRKGRTDVPDMTPEEIQRRGEAADALWRELVRRATAKP